MGAGRKGRSFTPAPTPDRAPHSESARTLQRHHLGGVIFGCTNSTMSECLSKQLFGLPGLHFLYVKNIGEGLPLFLFNYSDRTLHGIFEAASQGQMNIDPYGWTTDGSVRTQFPAQVQIRVRLLCRSLHESQFKPVIVDNYYSVNKFWFELDYAQANKLMSMLHSCVISPGMYVPQRVPMRKTDILTHPSRKKTVQAQWLKPLSSGATTFAASYNASEAVSDVKEAEQGEQHLICMQLKELSLQRGLNSECQKVPLSINADDNPIVNGMTVEENCNPQEPLDLVEKDEISYSWSEQKSGESTSSLSTLSPRSLSDQSRIDKLVQEVEELKASKSELMKKMDILEHKLEQADFEIKHLKGGAMKLEESTLPDVYIDDKQAEFGSQQSKCCMKVESEALPYIQHIDQKDIASSAMLDLDPNESIFVVGGFDGKSMLLSLDSYYPSNNLTKSLRPMSSVRAYASIAQLNGDLYVIGGGDINDVWYDTVESYSPADDRWKICPSLKEKKGSLAAATINNKIFAMGGGDGVACFSDVEMLDLDIGRWIRTQSMLEKRFSLAAAELNGVIYTTGGYDGKSYLKSVDRFDSREHSWKKVPCMNSKRACHSLVAFNEKLYALGGYDGDSMVSSVEIFDPRLESWMPGEPLQYDRGYLAAAVVGSAIYVIGGRKEDGTIADIVECYKEGQGWQKLSRGQVSSRSFHSGTAYST